MSEGKLTLDQIVKAAQVAYNANGWRMAGVR